MNFLNIPQSYISSKNEDKITYDFDLTVYSMGDRVKFDINGLVTSWMALDDDFITRIQFENLNLCFIGQHLGKEIEIKNILDEGSKFLDEEKYSKAIDCFDEVILYDENYAPALLFKSYALFGQGHFVKALRYYKRTLKADAYLKDIDYHRLLLKKSSAERDAFPKIKLLIFTGDEYFSRRDFKNAVESYNRALLNPSKFKSKIMHKLLNKKGTALFQLKKFEEAMDCFEESLNLMPSDYACFMLGFCRYSLDLPVDDSFTGPLRISKDLLLYRALILDGLKRHEDAIMCVDDLLSFHFRVDKIYFIALSCKISAMKSLGMDVDYEMDLLDKI